MAHIAEFDARRLYLSAGYPSMFAYCVHELHFSDDAAYKRIQAARAARQFSAIFGALDEGRLHLSAVVLLAPHLTPENADELIAAAMHKTKAEIELQLARRFPRTELLRWCRRSVDPLLCRVTSFPRGKSTLTRMSGQIQINLLRGKFAATTKPRLRVRPASGNARHIPAHVKRAVWQRDQGQCTYVSEEGQRCRSRKFLEFDHIDPVARGGQATVDGMRLRCRGHNQLEAEQVIGAEFMRHKREAARCATAQARAKAAEAEERTRAEALNRAAEAETRSRAAAQSNDVTACLHNLGVRADETRRAAAHSATIPDASLEERVRIALKHLCPNARCDRPVVASLGAGV